MIIALCGAKGSGKDTVAKRIRALYPNVEVETIAFADPIKQKVQHLFQLRADSDAQYDRFKRTRVVYDLAGDTTYAVAGRHVVREIGMMMREYDEWQFINYVDQTIRANPTKLWIVTDLRFDNEYEFLSKRGAFVVKVTRAGCGFDQHISERGFEDAQCHAVLNNDTSLSELDDQIVEIFDKVINEAYSR